MQKLCKPSKTSFSAISKLPLKNNFSFKNSNYETLGAWDNKLTLPVNVEASVRQGHLIPRIGLEYAGVSSLQGRRSINEDRMLLRQLGRNVLLLGMFDGHSSATAAEFCQAFMEHCVRYWLLHTPAQSADASATSAGGKKKALKPPRLKTVLFNSFVDCNNLMAHHFFHYCPPHLRQSGTTATVALIRNNIELAVGHVGDSRALLCRGGAAVRLSTDDEPGDNQLEQQRIRECGGLISSNSLGVPIVNGRLGMTRSLGDLALKRYGVTARPHMHGINISHGRDAFLVLVSDGISYVMSNREIVESVSAARTPHSAASLVTDRALQYGSEDNVSALVLPLGSWGKYALGQPPGGEGSGWSGGADGDRVSYGRPRFVVSHTKHD